ncbi:MAG: OmpA family protein, partial [Gammaproteobacteria bacterium]
MSIALLNSNLLKRKLWLLFAFVLLSTPVIAEESDVTTLVDNGSGIQELLITGENTEQNLSQDVGTVQNWRNEELSKKKQEKQTEVKKVVEQDVTTRKLKNVVPPILFKSGKADIPEEYVGKLRSILDSMRDRVNVRLHFVGHTDNIQLRGEAKQRYGTNKILSEERAGTTAEFFQQALGLPPEAISYEGLGESQPVASNNTAAGRAKNRRVEVQVWYDEVKERLVDKEVELDQKMKLVKICRVETVCKIRYKEGFSRRAKLKNLVPPFHYDEGITQIPASYLQQLRQALNNLRTKDNVQMRLIAYTDNIPLSGRDARIYGDHTGLSKARARRIAIAIQEALRLPNSAISSTGKGSSNPIATNDSEKGRALNRRIEVEFWHDDPLEDLPDEPQICPEQSAAETVEREYNPPDGDIKPIYFDKGQPVIPPGYAQRLQRVMDQIQDKGNVRLKFIGYINNERLDRRTAMVYGDDIGLSTARARRVMDAISKELKLPEEKATFEGRGFVQAEDVVNTGFVELDQSRVEVKVVYDELAIMDDSEGLEIKRLTREVEPKNPYALNLMRITVDGQPLNDPGKSVPDVQRCTDVALDKADIRFKYDNLTTKPRLNVTGWPNVISILDDVDTDIIENQVNFRLYSNYQSYLSRSEVRIFRADQSTRDEPIKIVELDKAGKGVWQYDLNDYQAPRMELKYVLRVYDKEDNFDETKEQTIWVVDELATAIADRDIDKETLVGYGENRLAVNNIPLDGGTINVYGKNVPSEHNVWFAGQALPVSDGGEFTGELIAPRGLHSVEVAITDKNGNGNAWYRDLELERSDWFYVGIADLTVAQDDTNGPAELVTGDKTHYDNDLTVDGRLAYYLKGRTSGNWTVTSRADTR